MHDVVNAHLQRAIDIATKAHEGQLRFDGVTPYIEHPKAVAEMFPPEMAGLREVAWLHDVLEDSAVTANNLLAAGIGRHIVEAVVALTKLKGDDYFVYLKRVKQNDMARKVKIMDILSNLSDSPTKNQVKKYASALKFLLS